MTNPTEKRCCDTLEDIRKTLGGEVARIKQYFARLSTGRRVPQGVNEALAMLDQIMAASPRGATCCQTLEEIRQRLGGAIENVRLAARQARTEGGAEGVELLLKVMNTVLTKASGRG